LILCEKLGFGKNPTAVLRDKAIPLINKMFTLFEKLKIDMTIFYRRLARCVGEELLGTEKAITLLVESSYHENVTDFQKLKIKNFISEYSETVRLVNDSCLTISKRMNTINPAFILRNYLCHEANALCEQGDNSLLDIVSKLIEQPFTVLPGFEKYYQKSPVWAKNQAGCGFLSCSS